MLLCFIIQRLSNSPEFSNFTVKLSYLMSELLQHNTKVELYCSCCCESLLTDVGDFWSSRRNLRAERFETFMRPLKGLLQQLQPAVFTCIFLLKEQDSPFYLSSRRFHISKPVCKSYSELKCYRSSMGALALLCCYINITSVVFKSQYYRYSHLFLRHYIIQ